MCLVMGASPETVNLAAIPAGIHKQRFTPKSDHLLTIRAEGRVVCVTTT